MLLATTVHTAGINWASVLTIISSTVVALSIVLGFAIRFFAKYIANQVTTAIDKLRLDVLAAMDKRIAVLEATDKRNRTRIIRAKAKAKRNDA
jgi:hypothetical protein